MPRNASGVYTLPLPDRVAGETVTSAWANTTMDDIATAITESLSREGDGGMNVPFEFGDGTQSAPGMTFANETSSGVYRAASNDLRVTIAGNDKVRFRSDATDPLQVYVGGTWTNILSDGATETITGGWTFTGGVTVSTANLVVTGAIDLSLENGADLKVASTGGAQVVETDLSASGFDWTVTTGTPAAWRFRDGLPLQVFDSADTENVNLSHDGTDGKVGCTNGDLLICSDGGGVPVIESTFTEKLRIRDAASAGIGGTTHQTKLTFTQQDDLQLAEVGFQNSGTLLVKSFNHGGAVALQAEDTGGTARNLLNGDPDTYTSLYAVGVETLRTRTINTSGVGTGAQVADPGSTFRPVGYNVAPATTNPGTSTITTNALSSNYIHKDTGTATYTLSSDSTIPIGAMWVVSNEAGGDITLSASGVTIKWFDGSAVTTGNRTVSTGGVATIYKMTNTIYHVWGSGIS